ncbi:MAG: hypothetical protein PHU63_04105, partial [Candidatus ainarchaeum sp.]|nr:hypothetical protein [Candidatus ainarchaeum sp.]
MTPAVDQLRMPTTLDIYGARFEKILEFFRANPVPIASDLEWKSNYEFLSLSLRDKLPEKYLQDYHTFLANKNYKALSFILLSGFLNDSLTPSLKSVLDGWFDTFEKEIKIETTTFLSPVRFQIPNTPGAHTTQYKGRTLRVSLHHWTKAGTHHHDDPNVSGAVDFSFSFLDDSGKTIRKPTHIPIYASGYGKVLYVYRSDKTRNGGGVYIEYEGMDYQGKKTTVGVLMRHLYSIPSTIVKGAAVTPQTILGQSHFLPDLGRDYICMTTFLFTGRKSDWRKRRHINYYALSNDAGDSKLQAKTPHLLEHIRVGKLEKEFSGDRLSLYYMGKQYTFTIPKGVSVASIDFFKRQIYGVPDSTKERLAEAAKLIFDDEYGRK